MTKPIKVLFICDVHYPDQHDDAVTLCLDYAKKVGCNRVVIGGDLIDLYSLSSFSKNPLAPSFREEIEQTKPLIQLLAEEFGETTVLAGNHERRLQHFEYLVTCEPLSTCHTI